MSLSLFVTFVSFFFIRVATSWHPSISPHWASVEKTPVPLGGHFIRLLHYRHYISFLECVTNPLFEFLAMKEELSLSFFEFSFFGLHRCGDRLGPCDANGVLNNWSHRIRPDQEKPNCCSLPDDESSRWILVPGLWVNTELKAGISIVCLCHLIWKLASPFIINCIV